jgi:hypothetical protein
VHRFVIATTSREGFFLQKIYGASSKVDCPFNCMVDGIPSRLRLTGAGMFA